MIHVHALPIRSRMKCAVQIKPRIPPDNITLRCRVVIQHRHGICTCRKLRRAMTIQPQRHLHKHNNWRYSQRFSTVFSTVAD
jgi:hypothetical protein